MTFDGERLRTTRINEAARIIYTLDKGLPENEKGQNGNISILSSQVGKTENEPIYSQVEGRITHNDAIIFGHVVLTTG